MKRIFLIGVAALVAVFAAFIGLQFVYDAGSDTPTTPAADGPAQIARGAYLARVGDCVACHTARGGKPYAGGRAILTQYGNIFAPNLTPDAETGIGNWSSQDFWRALHNGKSKDGKFLYPAFPYPDYTKITRPDADAMFAYFKTLEPVKQPNREHALRFPYNQRLLLAAWRALYFRPGVYVPEKKQSVEWNRGAYLVLGAGHCNACHTSRNTLGATDTGAVLAGGLIPVLDWYAPSLTSDAEAGLGEWDEQHIVDLLKTGVSARGAVFGPMAEVVRESLQYLTDADAKAMAGYLKSLPQSGAPSASETVVTAQNLDSVMKLGAKLYDKHCADCHQTNGAGRPPAYPPLAGNRALTMRSAINPIRMVLNGGYPPSTGGNPRPYGMPPFAHELNDTEVAAVVSYMRNSWGNRAGLVSPVEVSRYRSTPLN